MKVLARLLGSGDARGQPRLPDGFRLYAVGDVHGRDDLLADLLAKIDEDSGARGPAQRIIVFLGDLIDRGPNSAQVIDRLRNYRRGNVRTVFLLGNHEEVLLRILSGDASPIRSWLKFGGAECLQSYGVDPKPVALQEDGQALATIRSAIPAEHQQFLRQFVDTCRFGDYLFVHAGIRPGVPMEQQMQSDLRWIREPFLMDETDHGCVVVHGHTISPRVEERPNRIGLDTGAYRTGILTALAIEGTERWYLDTRAAATAAVSATH